MGLEVVHDYHLPLFEGRQLIEALGNRAQGLVFDAGSITVGEYLTRWLKDSVRGTVHVSTYEVHRHRIQPHIVPALGCLKLKDLNPAHVRALYREKLDSGLSAATVHKMHSVLRKALKQAVLDGLIPRNVCEAVKLPHVERKEITPWIGSRQRPCSKRRAAIVSKPSTCWPSTPA